MKRIYLKLAFISILSFIIISGISNATAAEDSYNDHYGDPLEVGSPVLQVLKWTSDDQVQLGDEITVFVNITNWSDQIAYNLTIKEPLFANWSRTDFKGYEDYVFTKIASGASVTYQYTMTLLNEGNYIIEPTEITYYNENSTVFHARSSFSSLLIYIEEPIESFDAYWKNILLMTVLFILLPIIVRVIIYYRSR